VNFWDSSALVPLLVEESRSEAMRRCLAEEGEILVWWGTPVECASAIMRAAHAARIPAGSWDGALARLDALARQWEEVTPSEEVRAVARRLLCLHEGLRSQDAFQLAAALVAAERTPAELGFVTADQRLAHAARREGFRLVS
jgi:hypothetical protein